MLENLPALLTAMTSLFGKISEKLDAKLDKTAEAVSAARLTSPFTLSLSGDATATAQVRGDSDVGLAVTLQDVGVTAGSYGGALSIPVITVDSKGRITAVNGTAVRVASTTQTGVVQLSSATNSTSTVLAATPAAVKLAYDAAAAAQAKADAALPATSAAVAAAKLSTARALSMTGDGTWTVSFDGSADVTAAFGLSATGVTAGSYAKVTVDAKGRVTAGTSLVASDIPLLNQNTTGSAATLTTARSIAITGDATWTVNFNGAANVTAALTLAASGVTAGVYTKVTVDAKGRVTAGAALVAADIPTLNQDTTGNAASATLAANATKWATARTLSYTGDATGSASLDGSANVAFALTLAASGVTAGTYAKVTVDAKGRVTAGAALTAADIPALDTSKLTTGVLPLARGGTAGYNIAGRNIYISTADPSGGADGDIWLKYV